MRTLLCGTAILGLLATAPLACTTSTAPVEKTKRDLLNDDATTALKSMEDQDPSLKDFMANAYGYVIFPSVGKGAVGIGGAFGRGVGYEGGKEVGYAKLTQGSIGLSLGGQTFRELIVFQTKDALTRFKEG